MASAPPEPADTGAALQRMAARTLIWIILIVGGVATSIGAVETALGLRALWASQRLTIGLALLALSGAAALLYRAGRPRCRRRWCWAARWSRSSCMRSTSAWACTR
jgi:hypothetical protein